MKRVSWFCIVLGLVLGLTALSFGQTSGQVRGTVVDASGAAIPLAEVSLTLPGGERALFTLTTTTEGVFHFASIPIAEYDVQVSARGFQTQTLKNVKVDGGRVTVLAEFKLQVQTVTSKVEVEGKPLPVETSDSTISSTITQTQLQSLPLINRSPLAILDTQAGVSTGRGNTVINGLRTTYANVTLDGINVQDNFLRENGLNFLPNMLLTDEVAEVAVTTSNGNSTLGFGGAQVNFVTPSGSNAMHGSLYYYNRNSALSANDWFNNRDGISRPQLNQHQAGGTLGGPILRDKLLFYTNYELFRLKQKSAQDRTILTADARQGIFTYRNTAGAVQKVNVLQAMNLSADPTTAQILSRLPDPSKINQFRNGDSSDTLLRNTGGYSFVQSDGRDRDNVLVKLDYHAARNHSFVGTYAWNRDLNERPDINTLGYTVKPLVKNDDSINFTSLAWRWSPSGNFTNEVRGGFNLAPASFKTEEEFGAALFDTPLISNPVNTFRAQGRATDTYSFSDAASWSRGNHTMQFGFQSQRIRTAPYNDVGISPTYALGIGTGNVGLTSALLPGVSATDLAAANSLLALLSGYVTSYSQTFNITDRSSGFVNGATNLRHFEFDQWGYYAQDKWRATRTLTINAGLRYDYFEVLNERDSLFLMPVITNNDPIATLLSNASLDFAGSAAKRPWYGKDFNNFAPSIGLAWDVFGDGRSSLRAGYSISYVNDQHIAAIQNNVGTNTGLSSTATRTGLSGRISTGLPAVAIPAYKVPRTVADNWAISTGSAVGLPDPNTRTPYVQQWNLSIQREVKGTVIEVRYVGNHATKQFRGFDYNQVIIKENGFLADFNRAMANGELARAATGVFNPAYTGPGTQPLTVFPQLASGGLLTNSTVVTLIQQGQVGELANIYQTNRLQGNVTFYRNPNSLGTNIFTNAANSNYHSLQIEGRRNIGGLTLQTNYTWGKTLSNASGTNQVNFEALLDNENPALEIGRVPFDLTHSFKTNWVYSLPIGEGHLVSIPKINSFFKGWSISGIMNWQSGVPFSINSGRGTLNRGARSGVNTANGLVDADALEDIVQWRMGKDGPFIIAASAIGADGRGVAPDGSPFFSGQMFANPTPGNNGTLARRAFNGPSLFNLDFGLMKRTTLREGMTLELKMDAANIFNNTSWNVGDQSINSVNFGRITSTYYSPRIFQLSSHIRF